MFFPSDSSTSENPANPTIKPTNGGFRRSKTDLHLAFQNYFAREPPSRSCWGRPRTESQIKMRLYQWAPKKPINEKSEGVQPIIDQETVMTEKNDEAKEVFSFIPESSSQDSFLKPDEPAAKEIKSVSTLIESEINIAKDLIKFLEKSEMDQNCSPEWKSESVVGNSQGWLPTAEAEPKFEDPPKKICEEKEEDPFTSSKCKIGWDEEYVWRKGTPPNLELGGRDNVIAAIKRNSTAGLAPRKKPSEIPLRKPTPTKSPLRKTKPVSLLMQKPLEEVESAGSVDISHRKKCITPIRELVYENSRAAMEGKFGVGEEGKHKEEMNDDIRLNRCIKSSNIPVDSEFASEKLTESRPGSDHKVKKLNLEKVKSSSLTILKSDALSRLESLHHQNVCAKENGLSEKDPPSKMKMLGAKVSFNGLRGKGSKKNLSARSSSKGNKPSLNIKGKVKKELGENSLPERSTEETVKNAGSRTYRKENPTVEGNLERSSKAYRKPNTVEGLVRLGGMKAPVDAKREDWDFSKADFLKSPSSDPAIAAFEKQMQGTVFSTPTEGFKKREDSLKNQNSEGGNEKKKMEPSHDNPPEDYQLVESLTESFGIPSKSFIISSSSKQKLREDKLGLFTKSILDRNKASKPEGNRSIFCPKGKKLTEDKFVSKKKTTTPPNIQTVKFPDLVVKGTALRFLNEKPSLKPREKIVNFQVDQRIDLSFDKRLGVLASGANSSKTTSFTFDWLFMNPEKCSEELDVLKESSNDSDGNEYDAKEERLLPAAGLNSVGFPLKNCCESSSSLKGKVLCKSSAANLKATTKKKPRSDAGDRRLATGYFNSAMSFHNKVKPDAKLRSGLTKSYREMKVGLEKDVFEDTSALKLRRRNSEPYSFRGFVWKRADLATPRGNKTSASSMASSLRHLNTDDLEDFIFWEVVPQKVTQCWETSLYHFKRPWSVLSCSVFKDNRQSSTPGVILANLRDGGPYTPSKRPPTRENGKVGCSQENSFDVEPSIAQKNIDIRNWLAALNFPTIPSTSNDVISEGSCCSQSSLVALNLSKNQVSPKRRNVLTGLKFPDEVMENKAVDTEKSNESTKWSRERLEPNLMDLIRKSGTFVSPPDILNPEISTENKAFYNRTSLEPQKPEKPETSEKKEKEEAAGPIGGSRVAETVSTCSCWAVLGKIFTGHLNPFPSDFNLVITIFLRYKGFFKTGHSNCRPSMHSLTQNLDQFSAQTLPFESPNSMQQRNYLTKGF